MDGLGTALLAVHDSPQVKDFTICRMEDTEDHRENCSWGRVVCWTLTPLTRAETTDGSLSSDDPLRTEHDVMLCLGTLVFALDASRGSNQHHWLSFERGALVALGARQWFQRVSVVSVSTFTLLPEEVPPCTAVSSVVRTHWMLG